MGCRARRQAREAIDLDMSSTTDCMCVAMVSSIS